MGLKLRLSGLAPGSSICRAAAPAQVFTDILFVTLKSSLTSAVYCSKFFEWVHHKSLPPKIQVCACVNMCVYMYAYMHTCMCACADALGGQKFNPLVSRATGSCDYVCGVGSLKSSIHSQLSRAVSTLNCWSVSAVPPSLPHQPNSWLRSLVSWWNGVLSNSLPVKWFYSLALSDYYNFHTTFKVTEDSGNHTEITRDSSMKTSSSWWVGSFHSYSSWPLDGISHECEDPPLLKDLRMAWVFLLSEWHVLFCTKNSSWFH